MSKLKQLAGESRAIFAPALCLPAKALAAGLLSAVLLAPAAQAAATITGVKAAQRYPWNGKVDIEYKASNVESTAKADGYVLELKVTAVDRATTPWTTNVATKTALSGDLSLADGTHRIVWDLDAQGLSLKSTNVIFAVLGEVAGVQLWENSPYWATCNVGATKPEEYGYYFWWGDTVGYSADMNNATWNSTYWEGVTWVSSAGIRMDGSPFNSSTCSTCSKSTSQLLSVGYIDNMGNLVATNDAATVHLGAPWRMPTDAEMGAIKDNCTTKWIENWNNTGVNGQIVTGKDDYSSKSIFLPAAGYDAISRLQARGFYSFYWSSTVNSSDSHPHAWCLSCSDSNDDIRLIHGNRYVGQPVRPVRGFAK